MFKGLGNIQELMEQAKTLNEKMSKVKEGLVHKSATGTAGGGMVEVTISGNMELTAVKFEPQVIKEGDVSMIEDLTMCAVNEALRKIQKVVQDSMSEVTGGLPIPGLGG